VADYYQYRQKKLQQIIATYTGDEKDIVELGCGAGGNLFVLYCANIWKNFLGFDISQNAIDIAKKVAEHFKTNSIRFGVMDLTDSAAQEWETLRGKTVFTYYCLEQLNQFTGPIINSIIKSGAKRVIHIEPTTEMLNLFDIKDLVNFVYIIRQDYQRSLIKTLKKLELQGKVRILKTERPYYSPSIKHDPTLVVWEPV
jgi:SAM-dependent methyltransferase